MSEDSIIFVVDDDEVAAASLHALLVSAGHEVEVYHSAEAFLAAFDRRRKGCLILDVRLSGMSGPDLQEELASKGMNVPVILISGHMDSQVANARGNHVPVAYLEKPFVSDELFEAVRAAQAIL